MSCLKISDPSKPRSNASLFCLSAQLNDIAAGGGIMVVQHDSIIALKTPSPAGGGIMVVQHDSIIALKTPSPVGGGILVGWRRMRLSFSGLNK